MLTIASETTLEWSDIGICRDAPFAALTAFIGRRREKPRSRHLRQLEIRPYRAIGARKRDLDP